MRMHGRLLWLAAMITVVIAAALTGCGGDDEGNGKEAVSGTFVGPASDSKTYVAIVIAPPGGTKDDSQVTAYVCDGDAVSQWFTGSRAATALDLSSEQKPFSSKGSAKLTADLSPEEATGTVRLPQGESLDFKATRATGPAGIYAVTALPNGTISGGSNSGGRVEGRLKGGKAANRLDATINAPDGQEYQLMGKIGPGQAYRRPDRAVELRWLVSEDGAIRGAGTTSKRNVVTLETFN
jgi:hypothetical protein